MEAPLILTFIIITLNREKSGAIVGGMKLKIHIPRVNMS